MNAPAAPAVVFKTISVPSLGEICPGKGGYFAGLGIGPDGTPHLVYVHVARPGKMKWQEYIDWCKTLEADGHTDFRPILRPDGALAYATMKDKFSDDDWYWTGEEVAGYAVFAWIQHFGYGDQGSGRKGNRFLACAVRSEPI